jgi:hypothetical protein
MTPFVANIDIPELNAQVDEQSFLWAAPGRTNGSLAPFASAAPDLMEESGR